jgi:hypothetical protein
MKLEEGLRHLEDMLLIEGISTFCYNSEETTDDPSNLLGEPTITIVIFSDIFIPKVRNFLSQKREKILEIFGDDVELAPQFLPYYLSYLVLGEYSKNIANTFLSTTFTNIDNPQLLNNSTLGFSLQIIGIIEGDSIKNFQDIKLDVKVSLEKFNRRSRFLKIVDFNYGTLNSRFQMGPTNLIFENIKLI